MDNRFNTYFAEQPSMSAQSMADPLQLLLIKPKDCNILSLKNMYYINKYK